MRNLHHDRVYYYTDWFLEILSNLNIIVSPEKDKRPLRRFIMGEKLIPIADPIRTSIKRRADISADFEASSDINSFFNQAKNSILESLKMKNIDSNKVTNIDFNSFFENDEHTYDEDDEHDMFEVTFESPETDSELALRQSHANTFNSILSHKDAIYKAVDKKLEHLKNISLHLNIFNKAFHMSNNDLTKFNLKNAGFKVSILTTSFEACANDEWLVAIYNNNEAITFTLSPTLSHDKACELMTKIKDTNIINLTLWDASPEHIWAYEQFECSMEDLEEQQLGEQRSEFISAYIHAGGNQWDAETEWNTKMNNKSN